MTLLSFKNITRKHIQLNIYRLYKAYHQIPKPPQYEVVSINKDISQHVKKGHIEVARKLFDEMPIRTVVSWNTMISGYCKWGIYDEALELVSTMHWCNVKLNESTLSSVLSACARSQKLDEGKQLHCLILKSGLEKFELVGCGVLYFYASCLKIEVARRVFEELGGENELLWGLMLRGYVRCNLMSEAMDVFQSMPRKGVFAWTTMVSGFAKSDHGYRKALELFRWMMRSGEVVPNEFTLDSVVRACARLGVLDEGRAVHGLLTKLGYESDQTCSGALIEFYCNCEALDEAKRIYDGIAQPCLSSSNTLIEGLICMGRLKDAEILFNRLTEMNPESCNLMIKGYAICGRVEESKRLFEIMPRRTIVSSNTMISVYSRNGEIDKALELFQETKEERNPVTWNSMISGFIHNGQYKEAIKLYATMCLSQVEKTRSTFSALFHACACLGSAQQGQSLHAHLVKTPFESNAYVGTSLVDMYSKFGSIIDAYKSFKYVTAPNVAAWTALINGYGHHGFGVEAILAFAQMLEQGIKPNAATFVAILSACSRAGLVNEGMEYFSSMQKNFGVTPTLEHYTCVVDLVGRSGQLKEAEMFIKQMPIEPDMMVYGALLSACWFWMDLEVGERVAEKMISLDHEQTSSYVTMSNIYAILGKWGNKVKVRKKLKDLEVKKVQGCSWIELNNEYHVFSVEDRNHPSSVVIYTTLEHLISHVHSTIQDETSSLLANVRNINATYTY